MFQRVSPDDALNDLLCPEYEHHSTMRAILDQQLLSPLSGPLSTSLTDGIRVENHSQALSIITKYLRPLRTPKEVKLSNDLILAEMNNTSGNFLLSLQAEDCRQSAEVTIEMRPIGALGWKLIVGNGEEQPEIQHSVVAQPLKVGERLAFPLAPIPKMKGASGFSTNAASDALRASPLFADKLQSTGDNNSPDLIIATGHGRFKISCCLSFWVIEDILHHEGHYAFAPASYTHRPRHDAQLRIDIKPLSDAGTELLYVESPPNGTLEVMRDVTQIITENFSKRSPNRKTRASELISS
jgi:hypothetical protein